MRGLIAVRGRVTETLALPLRRGRREKVALAAADPGDGGSRGRLLVRRDLRDWAGAASVGRGRRDMLRSRPRWRSRGGVDGKAGMGESSGVELGAFWYRDDARRRVRVGERLNGRAWRRHVDPPRIVEASTKGEHRTVRVGGHGAVTHGAREVRVGGELDGDGWRRPAAPPRAGPRRGLTRRRGAVPPP